MNPGKSKAEKGINPAPCSPGMDDPSNRCYGFSLDTVTWGYRDVFKKTIEELFEQGCLGSQRAETTAKFFEMLKRSDRCCFDHVLRQFLGALSPQNRWIMDLPGIFSDLVDTGGALADDKLYYGIRFFETLAYGGLGGSPQEVRVCLHWVQRLKEADPDLAMAFLDGYKRLSQRLQPLELERYVEVGLRIHHGNRESGCRFLRGELSSSEAYIREITQECRLEDVAESLRKMIKALTDVDCEMADLGRLDSDDLLERGTSTLTLEGHVYLPSRVRRFGTVRDNRNWYRLCGVLAAAMLLEDSFPRVHGKSQYRTCADLAGDELWRINLFQIVEFVRVIRRACRRWPGVRPLVEWGMACESGTRTASQGLEHLLADALRDSSGLSVVKPLRRVADDSENGFETARHLDDPWAKKLLVAWPAIALHPIQPPSFLSDFQFPVSFSDPSVAGMENEARHRRKSGEDDLSLALGEDSRDHGESNEKSADNGGGEAVFVYAEWDFQQQEYRPAWCRVHQKPVVPASPLQVPADLREESRKVRAIFERLKPDVARREKYLADGDRINPDLLVNYIVARHREPSPPIRFYEKPFINHRDLAVLVLLDLSGSTSEQLDAGTRVLDIEKKAGVILGQGLSVLGDRFALCGFSSNGREQCEYLVFKNFEESWTGEAAGRVMSTWPRTSTRIGPALRHSGFLLSRQSSRQRLIILVTDGKPMDAGYDPATRYAQHDVRMACEEIAHRDIHTFAISTEENSVEDMEIMFPRRRFAVMPDIRDLPKVLPRLYLRMTLV